MASAVGLTVKWITEVGYADFAQGLQTHRYDAFCGNLAMAPARARVASFTQPYYYIPYYAHVRIDDQRFKTLDDMNSTDVKASVIDGKSFK